MVRGGGRMRTGVTARVFSLVAGVVLLSSLASPTRAGEKLTVSLGGGLAGLSNDWSSTASWDSWAEKASLDARYQASSGTVFQGGLGFRFSKQLGVVLTASRASRDVKASLTAQIPHPLYLASARTVTGEASGLSYTELAFHLDLEWRTRKGPIEITAFAGPTLARVDSDFVQSINVAEAYPYDTATYQSAVTAKLTSSWGMGLNAGASAAWVLIPNLDLGVEARYVRASVDVTPTGAQKYSLNAGGLQVVGQLRLRF
jgi:hypothetical protein